MKSLRRSHRLLGVVAGSVLLGAGIGLMKWTSTASAGISPAVVSQVNNMKALMDSQAIRQVDGVSGTYQLVGLGGNHSTVSFAVRYGSNPAAWVRSSGTRDVESRFSAGKMEDIDHDTKRFEIHNVAKGGIYTGVMGQYLIPNQYADTFLDPSLVTQVQSTTYLGRNATEFQGNTPDFMQMPTKGGEVRFDLVVDNQTGMILKFATYHADGSVAESATAEQLQFNGAFDVSKAEVAPVAAYTDASS
ncbi:hypothetical protein GCM10025857_10740 [Alicyclobacillus contaminans]|uniref:hypothetical protein n=1 Tax=Alicyclobacillus contaminans TaxID=392016 RepID=UPI00040D8F86|nr:hypothetical protein [Alicyclobacillus contaminans]GMA49717.1 hypothetical protein GCM10025857_10740 [Alicyclobacillus contaminans]